MLDANTFSNNNVINYIGKHFVPLKINAEDKYGSALFEEFKGTGYPMLIFFDTYHNELERFYGYYPPDEFQDKLEKILKGENTFPDLLVKYQMGDQSSETMFSLANKYFDRGNDSLASKLYSQIIIHKNVSYNMFHQSKLSLGVIALNNDNLLLEEYINEFPESHLLKDAVNYLLRYFNQHDLNKEELNYYNHYVEKFSNDPWFLNQFAWRMTELNTNLDLALIKINLSLSLIDSDDQNKALVYDTQAEIFWKIGQIDNAIIAINKSIKIDPNNEYYKNQKNKFLETI